MDNKQFKSEITLTFFDKLLVSLFYSYTKLRDDPSLRWRDEIVSEVVLHTIESQDIDTVITFGRHGVSGHKNHCALYTAMAFLCLENRIPAGCRVFALRSVTILRKFSSILDVPMSFLLTPSAAYVSGVYIISIGIVFFTLKIMSIFRSKTLDGFATSYASSLQSIRLVQKIVHDFLEIHVNQHI